MESESVWKVDDRKLIREEETHQSLTLIDDRHRWLWKVRIVIRNNIRCDFGVSFFHGCGFFIERGMCEIISDFGYWMDYPKGDHVLRWHKKPVYASVMSEDGRFLFTGSIDRSIMVTDMSDDSRMHEWNAHSDSVMCLRYHRSGILVSGGKDHRVRVWNAHTHHLILDLQGHTKLVISVDVNQKGTRIVSGSFDKTIRMWSLMKGECIGVFHGHTQAVTSVRFLQECVISGSQDRSLRVWDSRNERAESRIIGRRNNWISQVCINCDESLIACLHLRGFTLHSHPGMESVSTVITNAFSGAFHPRSPAVLAVGGRFDYIIRVFDTSKGECIALFKGHKDSIYDLCFSADGWRLISVSSDNTIRVWDTTDLLNRETYAHKV